jgi:inorganic pyrophosphatase
MSNFFDVFKDLQESQVHAGEWHGADEARRTLEAAIAAYREDD